MNEPAFPSIDVHGIPYKEMTLRDYFAAHVLPIIANDYDVNKQYCSKILGITVLEYSQEKHWHKFCAVEAYKHADAMLEARKQ